MKIKEIFLILTISFCIAVVFLITSELLLRHILPEKINKPLYNPDQDLLLILKPNLNIKDNNNLFTTNAYSFRGGPLAKNPDSRIIVYGDSNLMARCDNLEQTFPYKLEKYLKNVSGKVVEVINAGVQGYGPDQYLIRFEKEAALFKPDLVIFIIFADNDFGDIIRNRLFELDREGNLRKSAFLPKTDIYLQEQHSLKYFFSQLLIVRGSKKIVNYVFKIVHLKREIKKSKEDEIQEFINLCRNEFLNYESSKPREFSTLYDHYDIDLAIYPGSKSATEKKRLMNAILKRANEFARAQNTHFLVLILPSVTDLLLKARGNLFSYYDLQKFPAYDRRNLVRPIEEACIDNAINYINLFDTFLRNDTEQLYRKDDNHWSDQGEELSAKTAAEYIVSKQLL